MLDAAQPRGYREIEDNNIPIRVADEFMELLTNSKVRQGDMKFTQTGAVISDHTPPNIALTEDASDAPPDLQNGMDVNMDADWPGPEGEDDMADLR